MKRIRGVAISLLNTDGGSVSEKYLNADAEEVAKDAEKALTDWLGRTFSGDEEMQNKIYTLACIFAVSCEERGCEKGIKEGMRLVMEVML